MNCLEVSVTPTDTLEVSVTPKSASTLIISVGLICDAGIGDDRIFLVDVIGTYLVTADGYYLTILKSE